MRSALRHLLMGGWLTLAGCAALAPQPVETGGLDARLDRWVAEGEYGLALGALAQVAPQSPDYAHFQARRASIQAKADAYARESVLRGEALLEADSWHEAWELYQQARARIPGNAILEQGYKRFREHQQAELSRIDQDLLVARGEWLQRVLPLRLERADVAAGDRSAQQELDQTRDEAHELGAELRRRGVAALDAGETRTARRLLPLAAHLDPSPESSAARERLDRLVAQRSRAKVKRKGAVESARRRNEVEEGLAAFESAYGRGELREARSLMARLKRLDAGNPRVQELDRGLEQRIDTTVDTHLQTATSLYSRGQFEEAEAEWRKVLELEPDNAQARANLDRAERVLGKLRELRSRQAQ